MNDSAHFTRVLADLLDEGAVLTDPARIAPMLRDHRALYRGHALAVVAPADTAAVARVLAFATNIASASCPRAATPATAAAPRPDASSSQVLLSLARLNRVRGIDAANYTMTAEAGCILAKLQAAAAEADRYLPLSLGSEGSCMLGGNLSTNAGGLNVIHYGMARELVLGLEVVLADGRVLDTLTGLRKDNTGYDIKSLFLGAEGTLGIITAACLKLYPALRSRATAFVAVRDPAAAVSLLGALRAGERRLRELVRADPAHRRRAHHAAHSRASSIRSSAPSAWYVLCELSSSRADEPLDALLQKALAAGASKPAGSPTPPWRRASASAKRSGGCANPFPKRSARMAPASSTTSRCRCRRCRASSKSRAAGWRRTFRRACSSSYGHLGDGNLHFNINQRAGTQAFQLQAVEQKAKRAIHDLVQRVRRQLQRRTWHRPAEGVRARALCQRRWSWS